MYETYWQIQQKPFESGADPRFYFPAESHQAALLKLRYAIESRRSGALLSGPAGCGKTLIVAILKEMLGEEFQPRVHLVFPQMTAAELLAYLAAELTGEAAHAAAGRVQESVRQIEQFLAANARSGKHAVVVIDEAHLLDGVQTWETLRLLLNFETEGRPGLTLVLAGQTHVLPLLDRMPQLEERLAVKCLIRPLSAQETSDYVVHRLKVAGAVHTFFESDALQALHDLTQGIARRINRLCDLALLIAYAEGHQTITGTILESIAHELVAVTPE